MKKYRDGDDGYDIIRPGDNTPTEYNGRPHVKDFRWVNTSLLERWRGARVAATVAAHTGGLRVCTEYNNEETAYEKSRQALAFARREAEFLPQKLEAERSRHELASVQAQCALQEVLQRHERATADHKIAMLERKERLRGAKARLKDNRRARRRARDAERRAAQEQSPPRPPSDDGPEVFRRHLSTMQELKANTSEGQRRIDAIYAAARAAKRNLTIDELMEVDAISDATRAAEDEIRRSAASDL